MDPVCDICGTPCKDTECKCSECQVNYCSDKCRKGEKICLKAEDEKTKKLTRSLFGFFGLGKDAERAKKYKGVAVVHLPGPISGDIPKAMRTVDSDEGKKVIEHWQKVIKDKYNRDSISIGNARTYYLINLSDLLRVFVYQLSEKQHNELQSLTMNQTK